MKYIVLFFSTLFFLLGILASRGLKAYFPEQKEYKEDVLLLASYTSGQVGAKSFCYNYGLLKSTGAKAIINCDLVKKCCPEVQVEKWGKDASVGPYTEINVLVSQTGKVHVRDRITEEILPVESAISLWSLPTLLMGQFILVLIGLLLKRSSGIGGGVSLIFALSFLHIVNLKAQSEIEKFGMRTVVQDSVSAELVVYADSFFLKKVLFDTSGYLLRFPEECLLCEISASDNASFRYCSENKAIEKKEDHYRSVMRMGENELYFQLTFKVVYAEEGKRVALIKYYIVDSVKNRKIRAMKKMVLHDRKWLLSENKLDAFVGMPIISIRDSLLVAVISRGIQEGEDLYELQEYCHANGLFELQRLGAGFSNWYRKNKGDTALMNRVLEKLVQ